MIYSVLNGHFCTWASFIELYHLFGVNVLSLESLLHIKKVSIIELSFICINYINYNVDRDKNLFAINSSWWVPVRWKSCGQTQATILYCMLPSNKMNVMHWASVFLSLYCNNRPMTKNRKGCKMPITLSYLFENMIEWSVISNVCW